mgnify:CR=1 FL=1
MIFILIRKKATFNWPKFLVRPIGLDMVEVGGPNPWSYH